MNVGDSLYLELSGLKSPAGKNNYEALATTVRNGQLVLPAWVVKNTKSNDAPLLVWHHFEDKTGGPRVLQQVRAFFDIDGRQGEVCFPSLATAHRCLNSNGHANFSKFRVYVKEHDGSISSRPYSDFGPKNGGQGYLNTVEPFSNTFYTTLDGRLSRIFNIRNSGQKNLESNPMISGQLSLSGEELETTATPKPKRRYTKKNSNPPSVQLTEQYNQLFAHENSATSLPPPEKRRPGRPKKIQSVQVGDSAISIQQMQQFTARMIVDEAHASEPGMLTLYQDEPLLEPADYQPPPPPLPEDPSNLQPFPSEDNLDHSFVMDLSSYQSFSNLVEESQPNLDAEQHPVTLEGASQVDAEQHPVTLEAAPQVAEEQPQISIDVPLQVLPPMDDNAIVVDSNSQQPPFKLELVPEDANKIQPEPVALPALNIADDCPQTPQLPDDEEQSPAIPDSSLPDSLVEQSEPADVEEEDSPEETPTTSIKRKSDRQSKQGSKRAKTASVKAGKPKATKKAGGRKKTIK